MRSGVYRAYMLVLTLGILTCRLVHAQEESTIETSADESGEEAEAAAAVKEEKIADLEKKLSDLEEKIAELEKKAQADELEKLREAAEEEAEAEDLEEEEKDVKFSSGARALQALNPEISITGDFVGRIFINEDMKQPYRGGDSELSGFEFRVLGLAFQTNLDPYSFTKVVIGVHEGNFGLGEAYMQWTGVGKRINLMVGKFRQLFGVINRWHLHALDQVDFPKPITEFFGHGGLNQVGFSMKLLLPRWWAHAEELTLQITNAMNNQLFAGEFWSVPSALGHLKNYYDLTKATYLEIGLSGLWGFNNKRSYPVEDEVTGEVTIVDDPWRHTGVAGVDVTLAWEPLDMAKYRWFVWRTEAMYLYKETEEGTIHAFGGFTYFDFRITRVFILGVRVDVGQQPKLDGPRGYVQAAPYLTMWQSPWVKLRVQYNNLWLSGGRTPEHVLNFQVDFSAGPHKHEKY